MRTARFSEILGDFYENVNIMTFIVGHVRTRNFIELILLLVFCDFIGTQTKFLAVSLAVARRQKNLVRRTIPKHKCNMAFSFFFFFFFYLDRLGGSLTCSHSE
jgi:hypothetical protein